MSVHCHKRLATFSAALFLGSATIVAADALRQPNPSPDMPVATRRLISFWNIGGDDPQGSGKMFREANPDATGLPPLYLVEPSNWHDFIEQKILPEYAWGVRRWLIHNPFGRPLPPPGKSWSGYPMRFDQYLLAKEIGLGYLLEDFKPAWMKFLEEHDDVEVIFYLGKLHKIERFDNYLPERPDLWFKRALDSAAPILEMNDLGASIAFDAASVAPENSPARAFVQLLASLGIRTYIESWPHKNFAHWGDQNIFCAQKRRGVYAGGGAGMREDDIQGEIVWLVNANLAVRREGDPQLDKDTPEGRFLLTDHLLRQNPHYTVAAPVRDWIGTGIKLEDLESAATHAPATKVQHDETHETPTNKPHAEEVFKNPGFGRHDNGVFILEEPRRTVKEILAFDERLGDMRFAPPTNRFRHLPVTYAMLVDGGTLTVLQLGDSIMNDIGRSGWMLRIENTETSPELKGVTVVRGTTGCDWYQHEQRIAKYVNPWQPDLVIIGGINNRDPEAVRQVVKQIRAGSHAEILLVSGAFGSNQNPCVENYDGRSKLRGQLQKVAEEMNIAYFDLRAAWADETRRLCSEKGFSIDDFKRDSVHANPLGEQVAGRLLARFLQP